MNDAATFQLGNGLSIDAENPEYHAEPDYCTKCEIFYYFGGHFCIEDRKEPLIKRSMKGYFDGDST